MQKSINNLRVAFGIVGCFVVCGLIASGFWWIFEMITGYTANLFALAGF